MDEKIKVSSVENPVLLEFLSLKPGVSQNIAVYALSTARNYIFLISAFLVHSTSFFQMFFQYK